MALNEQNPQAPLYVGYMDLSGGKNTKKDAHALSRNQLAESINCWYAYGNTLSKRPGSAAVITANGATGGGASGSGLCAGQFSDVSNILVQQGIDVYAAAMGATSFTNIGTLGSNPGAIRAAQMYDPETQKDTLFIVDGVDTPKYWQGPATTLAAVNVTAGHCPFNATNTAAITPKYVATNGAHLFYAGEPTMPCAVFISDAFYPGKFSSNASAGAGYAAPYVPYIVGLNDGINGGDITGIEPLGPMMLLYKQAAIYRMIDVGIYGVMLWKSEVVSASVGCLSPRSIVRFDTFHCFLGIDGVYQTDGESTRCISANVPTYFDSSLSGNAAIIQNRTTAIGARHGNRYLIFFDDGSGVPSRGLWFDFNKLDEDGLPTVGEIAGMKVAGMVTLRGPQDDGNVIWTDASQDRTGKFGLGFSDFGSAITMTFYGKADLMDDVFGPDAPLRPKVLDNITLLASFPQVSQNESITFHATVVSDLLGSYSASAVPNLIIAPSTGQWGQDWGTMVWTAAGGTTQYQTAKLYGQNTTFANGRVLQIGFQESSVYPVNVLGYVVYLNTQEVAA